MAERAKRFTAQPLTVTAPLTLAQWRRLCDAANLLQVSHSELARRAVLEFLRAARSWTRPTPKKRDKQ